jgi:GNAT superfamily N-acetyltransferase
MTAADAPAVADLATQLGYPASAADIEARLRRLAAAADRAALLVAVDDADRPIGWAHVELRDQLVALPAAQLMALVVGDGHRDQGVGRDLLRAAEGWATARDCDTLIVATRVTRTDAHRFYRREGYALHKTSHVFEKSLRGAPAGPGR